MGDLKNRSDLVLRRNRQ